jgi:hypothetical protein
MDKINRMSPDFDPKEVIKLCESCFEGITNLNFDDRSVFEKQLYRPVYDCVHLLLLVNHPEKMKAITDEVVSDLWEHRNKFLEMQPANFAFSVVVDKALPLLNSNTTKFLLVANYAHKILQLCKTF